MTILYKLKKKTYDMFIFINVEKLPFYDIKQDLSKYYELSVLQ